MNSDLSALGIGGVSMVGLRKNSLLVLLLLCSTPMMLSGCADSDEPDPFTTIVKYLRIFTDINKDELKGDVDIYRPTKADFERLNKKALANPRNASIFRNRGRAYYYSELPDHDKLALDDYNKAISLFSWNATWYSERSSVLDNLERYDEALRDINKAIQINGNEPQFYSARAGIYEVLGRKEEAFKDHVQAAKIEKPKGICSIDLAKELAKRGEESAALEVLNKVIASSEDYWHSDAHEERINILMCQGNFDQAQKEVADWRAETPPTAGAFKCSAKLNEVFGLKEKALDDYQQLVKLSTAEIKEHISEYSTDFEKRADYYDKSGEAKKAAEDRRKALAIYDKDEKEKRDEEALEKDHLEKDQTSKQQPEKQKIEKEQPAEDLSDIGSKIELYDKLGDLKKAGQLRAREIAAQDAIVASSPASADAYHSRGLILEERKKFDLALNDYARAMILHPKDNHYIGHHADCLNQLKRYQQAYDECKNGLKASTRYSEFVLGPLAEACEQLGKHEDAVTYATSKIKIDSASGDTYFWRSRAYEKLGKKELAKRDLILSKWFEGESVE